MKSRVSQIQEYFLQDYNCCQSVLASYCDLYGMDHETALKLAGGMGGGVGLSGDICGFVSGACLLLGLKHGKINASPEEKLATHLLCQKFCDDFKEKYGTIHCRDIVQCDINTPEAYVRANEENKFAICGECAASVAEILEKKYGILEP